MDLLWVFFCLVFAMPLYSLTLIRPDTLIVILKELYENKSADDRKACKITQLAELNRLV